MLHQPILKGTIFSCLGDVLRVLFQPSIEGSPLLRRILAFTGRPLEAFVSSPGREFMALIETLEIL